MHEYAHLRLHTMRTREAARRAECTRRHAGTGDPPRPTGAQSVPDPVAIDGADAGDPVEAGHRLHS
jgi:hypothetical protein